MASSPLNVIRFPDSDSSHRCTDLFICTFDLSVAWLLKLWPCLLQLFCSPSWRIHILPFSDLLFVAEHLHCFRSSFLQPSGRALTKCRRLAAFQRGSVACRILPHPSKAAHPRKTVIIIFASLPHIFSGVCIAPFGYCSGGCNEASCKFKSSHSLNQYIKI